MKKNICITVAVVLFLLLPAASAQPAAASSFYPLEEVKPGQKGIGKTVFEGSRIEEFAFEIMGVLRDTAPGQNMILARLESDRLNDLGVFAGMSGSPVYIEERLVGAVAYGFSFAKEPIAGITPIEEMVEAFSRGSGGGFTVAGDRLQPADLYSVAAVSQALSRHQASVFTVPGEFSGFGPLSQLHTPLSFSGLNSRTLEHFGDQFRRLGLSPVSTSLSGQAEEGEEAPPVEPGSTIAVQLVRGDTEISASGTVTYVSGNRVYAFGHPFLGIGYTDLPMSTAAVIGVIPTLMNSQKISNTGMPFGAIRQDRYSGILGISGAEAEMIPVALSLKTSRNEERKYSYEVVSDSLLTPLMLSYAIYNTLVTSEKSMGKHTIQVVSRISVEDYPEIYFQQSTSGDSSAQAEATIAAVSPVYFTLNSGFDEIKIKNISLEISSVEEKKKASLDKVWIDRTEIEAGEELGLTIFLRNENGDIDSEKYPIKIPEGVSPGDLKVLVADGVSVSTHDTKLMESEFNPRTFDQVVRAINNLKNNNPLCQAVPGGTGSDN